MKRVFLSLAFCCIAAISTGSLYAQEDEFLPMESFEEQNNNDTSDEFLAFDGDAEFSEMSDSVSEECTDSCAGCGSGKDDMSRLYWVLVILVFTILAGVFVRHEKTRNYRGLFLLASLLILGFYRGACPCPIMSLHHTLFAVFGINANWIGMIWILALLPITYFFGKVWCGWICHLGALQEFIFLPGKIKIMQSKKAQNIMRYIRTFLLIALIVQIAITQSNIFKTIDPFKVAFNLRATNAVGWILLGLLLLSSVFIYRPFCKTVCPIGLILGWISKLPGASIIAPNKSCVACKSCFTNCDIKAITRDSNISQIDNQECIACGKCTTECKKEAMSFVRNSKQYGSKSICKAP